MKYRFVLICLVVALFGPLTWIPPSPASGTCNGAGRGQGVSFHGFGNELANGSATCDNDKYYSGLAAENSSSQGNGSCAVVRGKPMGGSDVWLGYSCLNNNSYRSYGWYVGKTSGTLKMCHGWNSSDCSYSASTTGM